MGGQLRVHLDGSSEAGDGSGGRKWDIEPVLDRLVLFRSDLVDHEVSQKPACFVIWVSVYVCECMCFVCV